MTGSYLTLFDNFSDFLTQIHIYFFLENPRKIQFDRVNLSPFLILIEDRLLFRLLWVLD